jgi:hypothetical protein
LAFLFQLSTRTRRAFGSAKTMTTGKLRWRRRDACRGV